MNLNEIFVSRNPGIIRVLFVYYLDISKITKKKRTIKEKKDTWEIARYF